MVAGKSEKPLRFVALAYRIRTLGCLLGALPVASVLYQQQASAWLWGLALLNGLIWPHLAYAIASHRPNPKRAEYGNLLVDAGWVGIWVALMRFNLLPSAMLAAMLAMNHVSATGWRQAGRSMLTMTLACLGLWWLIGMPWQPVTDMLNVLACLPLLVINPTWLSNVNYMLAQRVRAQNQLLDKLNRTDALTGLPNRFHWLEAAGKALLQFDRHRRPAALILLDIDRFKQINDQDGHAAGDARLCELASVLYENMRPLDTPGRLGGDEFGVVLPDTASAQALVVAERIRRHVERLLSSGAGEHHAWTVSLGVAEIGTAIGDVAAWVHAADLALYQAKAEGRNRTHQLQFATLAGETGPTVIR